MAYKRLQENAKINDLIIGERYAIDDLYIIYGYFFYLDNVRYMESDELGADSGVLRYISKDVLDMEWHGDGKTVVGTYGEDYICE